MDEGVSVCLSRVIQSFARLDPPNKVWKVFFDGLVSEEPLPLKVRSKRALKFDDILLVMKPEAPLEGTSLSINVVVTEPAGSIGGFHRMRETHHIVDSLR